MKSNMQETPSSDNKQSNSEKMIVIEKKNRSFLGIISFLLMLSHASRLGASSSFLVMLNLFQPPPFSEKIAGRAHNDALDKQSTSLAMMEKNLKAKTNNRKNINH